MSFLACKDRSFTKSLRKVLHTCKAIKKIYAEQEISIKLMTNKIAAYQKECFSNAIRVMSDDYFNNGRGMDAKVWNDVIYPQYSWMRKGVGKTAEIDWLDLNSHKCKGFLELSVIIAQRNSDSMTQFLPLKRVNLFAKSRHQGARLSESNKRHCVESIIKNLMYLGDLCRYFAGVVYSDLVLAQEYYSTAHLIDPRSGKPFSKLGILAAELNNMFGSAYFYLRNLCSEIPESNAEKNLLSLLKNSKTTFTNFRNPEGCMEVNVQDGDKNGALPNVELNALYMVWLVFTPNSNIISLAGAEFYPNFFNNYVTCVEKALKRFDVDGEKMTSSKGDFALKTFLIPVMLLDMVSRLDRNWESGVKEEHGKMRPSLTAATFHLAENVLKLARAEFSGLAEKWKPVVEEITLIPFDFPAISRLPIDDDVVLDIRRIFPLPVSAKDEISQNETERHTRRRRVVTDLESDQDDNSASDPQSDDSGSTSDDDYLTEYKNSHHSLKNLDRFLKLDFDVEADEHFDAFLGNDEDAGLSQQEICDLNRWVQLATSAGKILHQLQMLPAVAAFILWCNRSDTLLRLCHRVGS